MVFQHIMKKVLADYNFAKQVSNINSSNTTTSNNSSNNNNNRNNKLYNNSKNYNSSSTSRTGSNTITTILFPISQSAMLTLKSHNEAISLPPHSFHRLSPDQMRVLYSTLAWRPNQLFFSNSPSHSAAAPHRTSPGSSTSARNICSKEIDR